MPICETYNGGDIPEPEPACPMSDVSPVNPPSKSFHVTQNPFLQALIETHGVVSRPAEQPTQPALPPLAPDAYDHEATVDPAKLSADDAYLQNTLGYMLMRARESFLKGYYSEAENYYNKYFEYQHFYGKRSTLLRNNYYFALFERGWLQELVGKHQVAEAALNQSLLHHLELIKAESDTAGLRSPLRSLTGYIDAQQQQGLLPSASTAHQPTATEPLIRLLETLAGMRQPAITEQVLHHIEVRQLLNLMRAERVVQTQFNAHEGNFVSPFLTALLAAETGLPMVPVLPLPPEESRKIQKPRPLDPDEEDIHLNRVEAIRPLGKDPRMGTQARKKRSKPDTPTTPRLPTDTFEHHEDHPPA
ncbi:MAG: hypothetical protein AB7P76_03830 [Candidatus Melainabacteria bacterium]